MDSGLVGSTDGRGAARAEDAQGTPTQSHISPSILVYEDNGHCPQVIVPEVGVGSGGRGWGLAEKTDGLFEAFTTCGLTSVCVALHNLCLLHPLYKIHPKPRT